MGFFASLANANAIWVSKLTWLTLRVIGFLDGNGSRFRRMGFFAFLAPMLLASKLLHQDTAYLVHVLDFGTAADGAAAGVVRLLRFRYHSQAIQRRMLRIQVLH